MIVLGADVDVAGVDATVVGAGQCDGCFDDVTTVATF